MNRSHYLLSLLLTVLFSTAALAADVTIIDQQGLTRASKRIAPGSAAIVRVTIILQSGAAPKTMTLKSSNGSEITSPLSKDGSYEFAGIPEGKWQMVGDVRVRLQSVQIFK